MKKSFYLSGLIAVCFSLFAGKASAQAAVITTDPVNTTVCAGSNAKFFVAATGATSYNWQVSADGGATWDTVMAGAVYSTVHTDTLKILTNASLNNDRYRAVAVSTAGNDTSAAAILHVDVASAGTLSGANAVCIGSTTPFASTAAGGVFTNVDHTIDGISVSGIDTGKTAGTDTIRYTVTNTCGVSMATKVIRVDAIATAMTTTGPSTVCVGNNITLMNSNTMGTYTWSSANTAVATVGATSGSVHGVAGGVTTITYTFTNACNTVNSYHTVTVDTVINPGTISGPTSVCNGSEVMLGASRTGGTWISSSSATAIVDGSGNVTGVSQGNATISYFFSNGCGVSAATLVVSVTAPAAAIGGNDSVGIGMNLLLTNTTTGGTWTSADPSIATVSATGLAHGVDTGVTTITYSVTNACGTTTATETLNVGPAPFGGAITGPDSVCKGATITLGDTTGYGEATSWVSKYDSVATVSSTGVVTGVSKGIDSVFATVTTAFGSTVIGKRIYVNVPPVVTLNAPGSISLGGSYTLDATPTGGTFSSSNDTVAKLIGYGFFVVLGHGTSILSYTVTNSCGTAVAKDTVTLAGSTAGIGNTAANTASLNVFPNPSTGTVTINLAAGLNETAVLTITNVLGEKVKEINVVSNENTEVVLDQPNGIYLLSATTAGGAKYSAKISIAK